MIALWLYSCCATNRGIFGGLRFERVIGGDGQVALGEELRGMSGPKERGEARVPTEEERGVKHRGPSSIRGEYASVRHVISSVIPYAARLGGSPVSSQVPVS